MKTINPSTLKNFLNNINSDLKPSQPRLSIPILDRIYNKIHLGITFPPVRINNSVIIDGHHRYIAYKFNNQTPEIQIYSAPTLVITYEWKSLVTDSLDWQSNSEVIHFNKLDAQLLNITVSELEQRINNLF
jgi:hypothetical protein